MKPEETSPQNSSLKNYTTRLSAYSPRKQAEARKLFETQNLFQSQAAILNEKRVVVYKKGKQLGGGYYIVEISSHEDCLFITTFDVEKA